MNDLVIIGCYPSNDNRIQIILEVLKNLEGFDTLVVSHFPICAEIQKAATFCLYDSENPKLTSSDSYVFYNTPRYRFHTNQQGNLGGHSLAVYTSMMNGFSFAHKKGYKSAFYLEGDHIVSEADLDKFKSLSFENTFFMRDSEILCTTCFHIEVEKFLELFPVLRTAQEYTDYRNSIGAHTTLESVFYKTVFNSDIQKKIINELPQTYFANSQIDVCQASGDGYVFDLVTQYKTTNIVFIVKSLKHEGIKDHLFVIKSNDEVLLKRAFKSEHDYYAFIPSRFEYTVIISNLNGKIIDEAKFSLDDILKNSISLIEFK